MNPYIIIGFLVAIAVATAGGIAGGRHYQGMQDEIAFQKERNKWQGERDALKAAGDKALKQAEGERDTLQHYVSDVLGPKYAALDIANRKFQNAQKAKGDVHAKLELPADDHACDLPSGMFDDWITNNRGAGAGQGGLGLAGGGLDTALRPVAGSAGTVPGGAGGKPSPGNGGVPRLRATP